MEICEDIRQMLGMKDLYAQRKETIERIFGKNITSSFKLTVLLLTKGCAQKPINVMYPMKIRISNIPVRNEVASDTRLTSSGPPAPPTIPEQRMPAKEP